MVARTISPTGKQALPISEIRRGDVGDFLYFGQYQQLSDAADGLGPIAWRILSIAEGRGLVIAHQLLECRLYHDQSCDITWEQSSLRAWLNGEFIKRAFSTAEEELILVTEIANEANPKFATPGGKPTLDKIFLLSIAEAGELFHDDDDRLATWTPRAQDEGRAASLAQIHPGDSQASLQAEKYFSGATGWWWLRSPGLYANCGANVHQLGAVLSYGGDVADRDGGVRPALWLDLQRCPQMP